MSIDNSFRQLEHSAKTEIGNLTHDAAHLWDDLTKIWDKDKNNKGDLANDFFGELKIVGSHIKDELAGPDAEHDGVFGSHGQCSIKQWNDGRMRVRSDDDEYSMERDKNGKMVEYYAKEDRTVTTTPDGKIVSEDGKTGSITTTSPDGLVTTVENKDGTGRVSVRDGQNSLGVSEYFFDKNYPDDPTKNYEMRVD